VSAAAERQQTQHRPSTRRSPAPRAPRRVSGPARPAPERLRASASASAGAGAGAIALPRPGRPSGRPVDGLAPRVLDRLRALPDHPLLERLLRGRAWIALVALALGGIVAMQVSMLKINAGIGRAVEHSSTLERQNAELRATVSALSSEERIQREAMAMGLKMPAAGEVRYLTARGAEDARKAARVMRRPDPSSAQLAAQQAAATAATTAAATSTQAADPAALGQAAPATATTQAAPAADPAATTAPAAEQPAAPAAPAAPADPAATAAPAAPVQQTPAAAPAGAAVAPTGAP